jgi:transposase
MLPSDFPPWRVVYQTFWRWRNQGLWENIMPHLRKTAWVKAGRRPAPTLAIIIDSRSIKTVQKGGREDSTRASRLKAASATLR